MQTQSDQSNNPRVKEIEAGDAVIFRFSIHPGSSPSEQINSLLNELSIEHMELWTDEAFENGQNHPKNKIYNITSVSIKGQVDSITFPLGEIHSSLENYFSQYAISDETALNKVYELSRCRYLIAEFLYKINLEQPALYDARHRYRLWFTDGKYSDDLHTSHFNYTETAWQQISDHHVIRSAFLDLVNQYIALQLERVKMLEAGKPLGDVKEDNEREKELLEVWLALKADGLLNHLSKEIDIANHRKAFFESFNLTDRDYNNRHANYKKKKKQINGGYLQKLADIMDKGYKKISDNSK